MTKLNRTFLSEYVAQDQSRKATVSRDEYHLIIDLHEPADKYKKTILVTDHSLQWAEDMAENYVMKVGNVGEND